MAAPVGGGGEGRGDGDDDDDEDGCGGDGPRSPMTTVSSSPTTATATAGEGSIQMSATATSSANFDDVNRKEVTKRPPHTPLRILTVGDGDLSFSLALLRCYNGDLLYPQDSDCVTGDGCETDDGGATAPSSSSPPPPRVHVTATTYLPSESALRDLYPDTASRILDELRARCHHGDDSGSDSDVLFGVDATMLHENHTLVERVSRGCGECGGGSFDCIVFNHPHLGYDDMGDESTHAKRHRALLAHYLHSASELLRMQHSASDEDDEDGRRWKCPSMGTVHVTLCGSQPRTWGLADAARRNGLVEIYSDRVERPITDALLAGRRRRTMRGRGSSPHCELEPGVDGEGGGQDDGEDDDCRDELSLVPAKSPLPGWRAPRKFRNGRLGSVHYLSKYGYAHVKTRPGGSGGGVVEGGGGSGSSDGGGHHRGTTTTRGGADVDLSLAVHHVFAPIDAEAPPASSTTPPVEESGGSTTAASSPTGPFPCRVCGVCFQTAEELRRHEEAPPAATGPPLLTADDGMTSAPPAPTTPSRGEDGDVSHSGDEGDAASTAAASTAITTSAVAGGGVGGLYRCNVTGRTYSSRYALMKSQDHLPLGRHPLRLEKKEKEAGGAVQVAVVSAAESTDGEGTSLSSQVAGAAKAALEGRRRPPDASADADADVAVDEGGAAARTTSARRAVLGSVVVPPEHDGTRLRKFARMRHVEDDPPPSGGVSGKWLGTDHSHILPVTTGHPLHDGCGAASASSLSRHLTSKRLCDEAIKAGRITVNGAVALDSSRILRGGDVVELLLRLPPPRRPLSPSDLARGGGVQVPFIPSRGGGGGGSNRLGGDGGGNPHVKIHYEDEDVVVAWKPVGVRPCGDFPGTLQSCLRALLASSSTSDPTVDPDDGGRGRGRGRFHPISRLETGCGGLCLVAKSDAVRDVISSRLDDTDTDDRLELRHVFVALVHDLPPDGWGTTTAGLSIPAGEDDAAAGGSSFWNKRRRRRKKTKENGDGVCHGGGGGFGVSGGGRGGMDTAHAARADETSCVEEWGGEDAASTTTTTTTTTTKRTAWHAEPVTVSLEVLETSLLPPPSGGGEPTAVGGRVSGGRGEGASDGGSGSVALSTLRLTVNGRRGRVVGALCHALRSAGNPVVGDRFCRDELASLPRSCRNVLKSKLWIGCYSIRCSRVGTATATATVTAYYSRGGEGTSSLACPVDGDYGGIEIRVSYPDRMLASYWTKLAGRKQVVTD